MLCATILTSGITSDVSWSKSTSRAPFVSSTSLFKKNVCNGTTNAKCEDLAASGDAAGYSGETSSAIWSQRGCITMLRSSAILNRRWSNGMFNSFCSCRCECTFCNSYMHADTSAMKAISNEGNQQWRQSTMDCRLIQQQSAVKQIKGIAAMIISEGKGNAARITSEYTGINQQ